MFQLYHYHKSMNSFRTCSSVTNSTTMNGPCLEIVEMKPLYKAITPFALIVFMAHLSPIQKSITNLVKAEQRGWWWFTRRVGAARFLAAGELSLSLSLSQTGSLSLCVKVRDLNPLFCFDLGEGERPLNFFFLDFSFNSE